MTNVVQQSVSTQETMTIGVSQPGEIVVITTDGTIQTWTIGGGTSMPTETGVAMTSTAQPPGSTQDTMITTEGSVETMSLSGSRPVQSIVVTSGSESYTQTMRDGISMDSTSMTNFVQPSVLLEVLCRD